VGFACGSLTAGLTVGILIGSLLAAALNARLDHAQLLAWGWRVPFLLGGLAGLGFLGYRARVPESPLWQATATRGLAEPRPVRSVVLGAGRRDFAQVLLLMAGLWLVGSSVISVLPVLLLTELERPAVWVTGVLMLAQVALIGAFLAAGAAGQRWGRRRTLAAGAGVSATAGLVVYAVIVTAPLPGWLLAVGVVATEVLVLAVWGAAIAYVTERFATTVRASGFGLGYSLAVVPASFYAFYLDALAHVMPVNLTQLVLLAAGGTLAVLGALLGPETRHLDLADTSAVTRRGAAAAQRVANYPEVRR
jgi:MFS family permease